MITIAVCDDNVCFNLILKEQLEHLCFPLPEYIEIHISTFCSVQEVTQYLQNHSIQIIFLDIQMAGTQNGFSLAESLHRDYPEIIIIFVSSYDDYVFDSLKYRPFRFIRKRLLDEELPEVLHHALNTYHSNNEMHLFHTTDGDQFLSLHHILYLESAKNYYILHCTDSSYKCRGSLSEIEGALTEYHFCRIHSSFLVNMKYVKAIYKENWLLLTNGSLLRISRSQTAPFKEAYFTFLQRRSIK